MTTAEAKRIISEYADCIFDIETDELTQARRTLEQAEQAKADPLPAEPEPVEDDPITGNIEKLFSYRTPEKLAEALAKKSKRLHEYFYHHLDAVPQAIAALMYQSLKKDGLVKRSDNVIWIYFGKPYFCFRPVVDYTRPNSPIQLPKFLIFEERFIRLQGTTFTITDEKDNKKSHIYRRGAERKIAMYFFTYVAENEPHDPHFLNTKPKPIVSAANGIIDLTTGEMRPHGPENKLSVPAFPWDYDPEIDPEAEAIANKYFENLSPVDDPEPFTRWLKFQVGYTLTPWRRKKFFANIGDKDSGKTTFQEVIEGLHAATSTAGKADLIKMANRPGDFDYEAFEMKYVVFHDDFPPGGTLPAIQLKELANKNTTIKINKKFKPSYHVINTATIHISANDKPRSKDSYISERVTCTFFENQFDPDDFESEELVTNILSEEMKPVIFNIGIKTMLDFFATYRGSFSRIMPEAVKQYTREVVESLNDAADWLRSKVANGELVEGTYNSIERTALFDWYLNDRGARAMGRNDFYVEVKGRYREQKTMGEFYYFGIGRAKEAQRGENVIPF